MNTKLTPYYWESINLPNNLQINPTNGKISGYINSNKEFKTKFNILTTVSSLPKQTSTKTFSLNVLKSKDFNNNEIISKNGIFKYATNNGRSNPQFLSKNNNFYTVYQSLDLKPEVLKYNKLEKQWTLPIKINNNSLNSNKHGHPVITIDSENFLHIFYGANFTEIKHVKSKIKNDISNWNQMEDIGFNSIYPSIISLPNNELLLFNATSDKKYIFFKSSDNGQTWNEKKEIIFWGDNYFIYPDAGIIYDNDNNIIHLSWSTHSYIKNDHQGIYYAKSINNGNSWTNSNNKTLNLPINSKNTETIYFNENEITYGESITFDENGNPAILFTTTKKPKNLHNSIYKLAYKKK